MSYSWIKWKFSLNIMGCFNVQPWPSFFNKVFFTHDRTENWANDPRTYTDGAFWGLKFAYCRFGAAAVSLQNCFLCFISVWLRNVLYFIDNVISLICQWDINGLPWQVKKCKQSLGHPNTLLTSKPVTAITSGPGTLFLKFKGLHFIVIQK